LAVRKKVQQRKGAAQTCDSSGAAEPSYARRISWRRRWNRRWRCWPAQRPARMPCGGCS